MIPSESLVSVMFVELVRKSQSRVEGVSQLLNLTEFDVFMFCVCSAVATILLLVKEHTDTCKNIINN